jgi:CDP-diacylglycerol--serine O-phosphatidyltransferase
VSTWSTRRPGAADVLTLCNALCGAAAILVICWDEPVAALDVGQRYEVAALLFVCGTVFDVLDGAAARRWGGTPLGAPLDCLADGVTFGVAPVVAVTAYVTSGSSSAEQLVVAAGALAYVAAALVRLADFMAHYRERSDFVGLPTTSACVAAVCLGFLSPPPALAGVGLAALAFLMVSPLAYPAAARVLAVCLAGWALGVMGIIGVLDVRVPATLALLTITLVVPVTTHIRARAVAASASA